MELRALRCAAFAVLVSLALPTSSPAAARRHDLGSRAERLVSARVAKVAPKRRAVSCARVSAAAATRRWSCRWSGATSASACRGTYGVRYSSGRFHLNAGRRTCARSHPSPSPAVPKPSPSPVTPAPATPVPTPSSPVTPPAAAGPLVGFNDNGVVQGVVDAATDAQLTQRVGATVTRLGFDWRWAEPSPGEYHLSMYDDIYREDRARGIRPLFILVFAPSWANNWACNQWTTDCHYPPSADHFDDAGRMAALLARRYPEAAGIEVWNEPNITPFWQPSPDAAAYAGLLRAVYSSVKAADPNMPVIGGSMAVGTGIGDFISPYDFTSAIYEHGAGGSMDALSVHPYPYSATSLYNTTSVLDSVRSALGAHGAAGKPLWVSELGITTTGPWPVTESEQASTFTGLYRTLRAMPDVKAIMFHTLVEPPTESWDAETGYGIVRRDLSPKPAYCSLARELGRASAC